MPAAPSTSHRLIDDLALPYASYISPIDSRPFIFEGLNVLTAQDRVLRRRPGFAATLESVVTTFGGRIQRIYTWRKWNRSNFVMICVVTSAQSVVYKLEIGRDSKFIQLVAAPGTTPFDFIAQHNECFFGNGTPAQMWRYTGDELTTWGIDPPTVAPVGNVTAIDKGINAQTDYHLRYTFWDAKAGHESSVSEVNDCIGQFTNSAINWTVFASTNPRVTHIRLYRTRDGGSTDPRQMQELPSSPIPNANTTVTDFTEDADLRNQFAPGLTINDPPPPMRGFVSSGVRIYGFTGDEIWFSGYDEVTNGIQEECFKGAKDHQVTGNFFPWNDEIGCLATMAGANAGVAVFLSSMIYQITGELRNGLGRGKVEDKYGARFSSNTTSYGSDLVWFDVGEQVRTAQLGELSLDIRPDVATFDPQWVQLNTHIGGGRKWLCVLDGVKGNLYVFDADTQRWEVPWGIGATAIHSGEIAPGKRVLYAAINNQLWYMVEGKFNDAGTPYEAYLKTSLVPLAPADQPDVLQAIDSVTIERDKDSELSDIKVSLDELPTFDDAYVGIKMNEGDPTKRKPGTYLVARRYTVPPDIGIAERMSIWLEWAAIDQDFALYSINGEVHPAEAALP
jgi:hypothetical protein